ncbi:hypothetical protein PVK06_034892 [Gossypium arboreum]|uniref:Uncharacterized protein n=1 Tax=Gossypium arboreum TaxID=29729 RepID=A0ABR0NFX4_GOSAR|nr:hypothetical protein PVK06_034892 [Gossypium arboreum]
MVDFVATMEGRISGFEQGHATTKILAKKPKDDELMDLTNAKVLNESERVGAASQSRLGCKWFQTFLFDYKIRDLGYSCSQFTWSRGNLSQRLDKVMCYGL